MLYKNGKSKLDHNHVLDSNETDSAVFPSYHARPRSILHVVIVCFGPFRLYRVARGLFWSTVAIMNQKQYSGSDGEQTDIIYDCSIVIRRRRAASSNGKPPNPPLDISNIIRGGPRKAKFKCELGRDGDHALKIMTAEDLDFSVVDAQIPQSFLTEVSDTTEWAVQGGEYGTMAKIRNLKKVVVQKDADIQDLEECLELATKSIKSFHEQQKQLYNDFVTLRDKYDVNKKRLRDLLWGRLANLTREFAILPQIQEKAFETENDIEQYRMGAILGTGEFATVRAATVSEEVGSVRRKIAIKVIDKERITTILGLQRSVNEIRVLRESSHPNILILFDVLHTKKYLYLVVERGHKDLYDYLEEMDEAGIAIKEAVVKSLVKQLINGVDYLHDMNVCHRDLKPENLLLIENSDDKLTLKILDFGMCTTTGGGAILSDKAGTPGFMAPEMIVEETYDGFLADMFSVGCIFLELVVGHTNFEEFWMTAYDMDGNDHRDTFSSLIDTSIQRGKQAVKVQMKEKLLSGAGEDLMFLLLDPNPKCRPNAQIAYQHRWVGGKPRARGATGTMGMTRTRRTRSTNDLLTLDERGRVPAIPMQFPHENEQAKPKVAYEEQDSATKAGSEINNVTEGIAATSVGDPPKSKLDPRRPPQIDTSCGGLAAGGRRRHILPPVEPMTPSIAGARSMLDEGAKLAKIADSNNQVKRIPTPVSPLGPSPVRRKKLAVAHASGEKEHASSKK